MISPAIKTGNIFSSASRIYCYGCEESLSMDFELNLMLSAITFDPRNSLPTISTHSCIGKQGGDVRAEGQTSDIGGGTGSRSVYGKEKMGVPKKPPMYLHIQTAGGAHRVGYNNMKCQHTPSMRYATREKKKYNI